jgi:malonate-semialdehyde dehydrogenase (acetylating) / methylmalonate-semialdehyde dehydrogenase
MTAVHHHFINGASFEGSSSHFSDITDPARGAVIGQVNFADNQTVEAAVSAADAAFASWAATPPLKRARVLFRFKDLLEANADKLAAAVTREHGKVLADAHGSVARAVELCEFACGAPKLLAGDFSENVAGDIDCHTVRQALGVCVGVSPFNFPVMIPVWLSAFSIACGNTFVLKPSEKDPAAPLLLAELWTQAGLPPGVFNVVNGDKDAVQTLITHPSVKAVSAVASTPVAQSIYQTAIANGKRTHTFGGAKNHALVCPDADIEDVANTIMAAAYGSAGERCMALSVAVVVGDESADKLVQTIQTNATQLTIGPGDKGNPDMGPLISREHHQRVTDYIQSGVEQGASLLLDGRDFECESSPEGFFLGPTLFDNVTPGMQIYDEEIFGPVLSVVRVDSYQTGLDLINQNRYGNGTAIFTNDGLLARDFASKVQVGMVGVNVPIPVPIAYHSFGGWKDSFFGDVHLHGEQSIQFYTKLKTISTRWPTGKTRTSLMMPSHHD